MHQLKISVITVCYNAENTIARCINSVLNQDYNHVEYIVVDGCSTDSTHNVTKSFQDRINCYIAEPDKGIYDAMNKGIALATGDVIGMLNADDHFADEHVLSKVSAAFLSSGADIIYADLDFTDRKGNVIRRWRSGEYKNGMFNFGWMPPHPTFYVKRQLFEKWCGYSLNFGTAADYELMLRFIHLNKATVFYLKTVLIKMDTGGVSNRSPVNRVRSLYFDLKAMFKNKIIFPPIALIMKPLKKLNQYFLIK